MKFIKTRLDIGVGESFSLLHISDTHLTRADMRDGERKVELAAGRSVHFTEAEDILDAASKYSKENRLPILHSGDLIDFVSIANLELAKKFNDDNDCFAVAGNHEFSQYVGEAKEDAAYREQSLATVSAAFKNNIRLASRVISGVNFVALDNGYYQFDREQFDFLKKEVEKGLPTVLLMHNPLYEPRLYDIMMKDDPCAYLVGVPDELTAVYPKGRAEQQIPDELTRSVIRYIEEEPSIKAIVAGHLHFSYEGLVAGRIPQIITSGTTIREIEFN